LDRAVSLASSAYRPRSPEDGVLYQIVPGLTSAAVYTILL